MGFNCNKLYIDISKPSNRIIDTEIILNIGCIKFYKKPITCSDIFLSNISGNIIIYGSIVTSLKCDIQINNKLGLPLLVYRKYNDYSHEFINETDTIINIHPLGLNCNTFVDGASTILEFGKETINGEKINPKFKVLNNSMFSLWYPHQHGTSSSSIYSDLIMPFIIKDKYSDSIDHYFNIDENDFIFITNSVIFDKQGNYNSDDLYSLDVDTNAIINFNGNLIGKYTPLKKNNNEDEYDISDILDKNNCSNFETDPKLYKLCNNLLRLRLSNSENKFRRHYYGLIDNHTCKCIDFNVIGQGCGFVEPYKTKMISLSVLDKKEILIDLKCNPDVSLVLFDFDITEIKSYYLNKKIKSDTINTLSIYTGCYINELDDNYKNIFDNYICKMEFMKLLNDSRQGKKCSDLPYNICCNFKLLKKSKISDIDCVIKLINHITTKDKEEYYYNWPNHKVDICDKKIRNFYFNGLMEIYSQSWFNFNDKSELPSILFKIENCKKYKNIHPNNILYITEICKKPKLEPITCCGCNTNNCNCPNNGNNNCNNPNDHWGNYFSNQNCCVCGYELNHDHISNIKHHVIEFDPTCLPLNLCEFKRLINYKFKEKCIDLHYNWKKAHSDINGFRTPKGNYNCPSNLLKDIKIVEIILENNSQEKDYIIEGSNSIMQFLGIEFMGMTKKHKKDKKHELRLGLSELEIKCKKNESYNGGTVKILNNIENNNHDNHLNNMLHRNVSLELKCNQKHTGNPFKIHNDYIMNFTVEKDDTEIWKYTNYDINKFHSLPLHFHLTSGFIIKNSETSIQNINENNFGSLDSYSISPLTNISFLTKFSNYSSNDNNQLGYMFHCHFPIHHDMMMMGQFYVDDKNCSNEICNIIKKKEKNKNKPCIKPSCIETTYCRPSRMKAHREKSPCVKPHREKPPCEKSSCESKSCEKSSCESKSCRDSKSQSFTKVNKPVKKYCNKNFNFDLTNYDFIDETY